MVINAKKVGVYAGLEWIKTCNCACKNTFQFPIIIYPSKNHGVIDREVVYTLRKHQLNNKIHGISITGPVDKNDEFYEFYLKLIQENISDILRD